MFLRALGQYAILIVAVMAGFFIFKGIAGALPDSNPVTGTVKKVVLSA